MSLSVILQITVLLIAPVYGVSYVSTSGYSLKFDGRNGFRTYVEITPQTCACTTTTNAYATVNLTISAWIKTAVHTLDVEQALFGFPFQNGVMIVITRSETFHTADASYESSDPSAVCISSPSWSVSLVDGQWHFVAYAATPSTVIYYVDGVVVRTCTGKFKPPAMGSVINVGVYDPTADSANSQPFHGEIDDARIYRRALLTTAAIRRIMYTPPSAADLQDMILYMPFDEGSGTPIDHSAMRNAVRLGGGLLTRSPVYVPSTAPTIGPYALVLDAVQDASIESAPSVVRELLTVLPVPLWTIPADRRASITIIFATLARFSINGVPIVNGTIIMTSTVLTLRFHQSLGEIGPALAFVNATVRIWGENGNPAIIEQAITIIASVRANRPGKAGGPGLASSFNGISNFYMADQLAWPRKTVAINRAGVVTNETGLSAVTIEFWGWVDASCAKGGALISLNGNGESSWSGQELFNSLRQSGRWLFALPGESGALTWYLDSTVYTYPLHSHYSGWAHYALVHDGVEGTAGRIYINGELVLEFTHDHQGFQFADGDQYNHVVVGAWTFWSEVNHKGIIDELRLWTRSRTQVEIQRDMWGQLTGKEPGLFSYWTFDDSNPMVASDRTGRGNDLHAGGCVSCEPRFYSLAHLQNASLASSADCIPSAKSPQSSFYLLEARFGGTMCFRGNERPDLQPTIVPSAAPIGGFAFGMNGMGGDIVNILLNGTDPDRDPLTFWITVLPARGLLLLLQGDGVTWAAAPNLAPFALPAGQSKIRLITADLDGGYPFATITYMVHDTFVASSPLEVSVNLGCPRGYLLSQVSHRCLQCPAGSFQSSAISSETSCTPCPINTYQASMGQTACLPCPPGASFTAATGSTTCTACVIASTPAAMPATISIDPTRCGGSFLVGDMAAGASSVVDFKTILPSGTSAADVRVLLKSLPRHGRLYQMAGDNLNDYTTTRVHIETVYVDSVVSASSSIPSRPTASIVGTPDVHGGSGSSASAWAAFDNNGGAATIVLHFPTRLYLIGVAIYENVGGGAVTRIESERGPGDWVSVWSGTALPTGLATKRVFKPSVCPSPFPSDVLRLTVDSQHCNGRNEIDAVAMIGSANMSTSNLVLIQDPDLKVTYVIPPIEQLPGATPGSSLTDSVSFEVVDCINMLEVISGVQDIQSRLGEPHSAARITDVRASATIFGVAVAIAVLGIILCIVSALLLMRYRKEPIIMASSVLFMAVMLLGIGIGFVNLLLTGFVESDHASIDWFCQCRPFLLSLGFVCIMGSIVVKTARIVYIFEIGSLTTTATKLPDRKLLLWLCGMLAIEIVNNITWTILDAPTRQEFISGTLRYHTCAGKTPLYGMFTIVSVIFKVILTLVGLGLTVLARNVPTTFNEVKALSFMLYSVASQGIVFSVLSVIVEAQPNATLMITTVSTSFALFSTLIILVGFKIYIVVYCPELNVVVKKRVSDVKAGKTSFTKPGITLTLSTHPVPIARAPSLNLGHVGAF